MFCKVPEVTWLHLHFIKISGVNLENKLEKGGAKQEENNFFKGYLNSPVKGYVEIGNPKTTQIFIQFLLKLQPNHTQKKYIG